MAGRWASASIGCLGPTIHIPAQPLRDERDAHDHGKSRRDGRESSSLPAQYRCNETAIMCQPSRMLARRLQRCSTFWCERVLVCLVLGGSSGRHGWQAGGQALPPMTHSFYSYTRSFPVYSPQKSPNEPDPVRHQPHLSAFSCVLNRASSQPQVPCDAYLAASTCLFP